jgi:hypothetical protein
MSEQASKYYRARTGRCLIRGNASIILCLFMLLALALLLAACGAPSSAPVEVVVRTALPTPTLEPTFTPSPSPTSIPQPSPTATPQSLLSGRILDQDTNQPITGATVRVGTASATTDAEGRYALSGLPPGQYALSVTHPDYDPGLSSIFTLAAGQAHSLDLSLFAPDNSPYPKDPMLTNPLDPNGAPTAEDAERLARLQGLTGEVVDIRETKLSGEYLVNYKIDDDVRDAVAELNHEVWELTDDASRTWWILKVCGNLASPLPAEVVATPQPQAMPLMAVVNVNELPIRACASQECEALATLAKGTQTEVKGCLGDWSWCQVGLTGGEAGWCRGGEVRFVAAVAGVPVVTEVLPTATPISTPMSEAGYALRFDGADDYIDVPTTIGFSSMSNITFEAWVRFASLPPSGKQFGIAISGDATSCQDNFGVMVNEVGAIYAIVGTQNTPNCLEGPYALTSSHTLQIGKWHHIAVTYEMATGTFAVYIDGLLAGTATTDSSGLESRYHHFGFGRWNDGAGFPGENFHNLVPFRGDIDEVRIWGVARAEDLIQSTMNTPLTGNELGLVSYWNLDEGNGQTVYDATDNHNDGQLGFSRDSDSGDPSWFLSDAPLFGSGTR